MKKSIFLTLLLAAFFVINANPVDVDSAKEIGAKFLKASTSVKTDESELQLVATYSMESGEAAFFVFNANKGFVIVAADDCATPILGYSDEGVFDVNNVPIQMQEYLNDFVGEIQYAVSNNITQDEKTAGQWELVKATGRMNDKKNTPVVGPLLTATWGQGQYYNSLCPADASASTGHVAVGCVAVAMGQIMCYHGKLTGKPVNGNGTHGYTPEGYSYQYVDYGATTYDWTNMSDKLTNSSSQEQKTAVATLLWHCGVAVDMMYGAGESGAYSVDVPDAMLNYFRYSNELSYGYRDTCDNAIWLARVKDCLDLNRPIYYSGTRLPSGGHAFVCDGYDDQDLLHMNWGWNGSSNAWVAVDAVNAGERYYKYYNFAIFNMHPADDGVTTNHTITVSANKDFYGSVSGGCTVANGTDVTITATPNDGYAFWYWSENGGVVSTSATHTFKAYYNRNLVAVFGAPNSITVNTSVLGSGGTVSGSGNYSYGEEIKVTASPSEDYTFCYWLEGNNIVSADASYTFTVTETRSLVARFMPTANVCEVIYEFADSYGDGWQGNQLVVTYEDTYTETMTLPNGSFGSYSRNVVISEKVRLEWVLGLYVNECSLCLKHGYGDVFYEKTTIGNSGFTHEFTMDCTSDSGINFLRTYTTLWSDATNWEDHNKPSSTSIVGIRGEVNVDQDVTITALNIYDDVKLTINAGKTLTVLGTIAEMPGATIQIEDGGQLVNATAGINGFAKKEVSTWIAAPVNYGWHAISTPVDNVAFADVKNLTNATYNVYRYNEATMTWENSQNASNLFNSFENGRGYIYRRAAGETLEFHGTFNTSSVDYHLTYEAANDNLKGFHLIGNPYPHNIYKGDGTAILNTYLEDGYYTLLPNGTWSASLDNTDAIKPCQAILVQAKSTAAGETLVIKKVTDSGSAKDDVKNIRFSVSNSQYEDVAYAIFKDGEGLNKIEHQNDEIQKLYINKDGSDFAVADIDYATKEFNLNIKVVTTGRYTLKVNADGNFSYLHLLDRYSGNDVDLLSDGEYSFIGSPSDAAERFIVKLSENAGVADSFVYQSGADVVVCGEGILQVFDVTGRMISTRNVHGVETIRKPSQNGVYIFRLLGSEVKTQKIVIE